MTGVRPIPPGFNTVTPHLLWYHLAFLALLLPGNVVGGVLRRPRAPAVAATA